MYENRATYWPRPHLAHTCRHSPRFCYGWLSVLIREQHQCSMTLMSRDQRRRQRVTVTCTPGQWVLWWCYTTGNSPDLIAISWEFATLFIFVWYLCSRFFAWGGDFHPWISRIFFLFSWSFIRLPRHSTFSDFSLDSRECMHITRTPQGGKHGWISNHFMYNGWERVIRCWRRLVQIYG